MSRPKTHAASCRLDYGRKGILVGRRYYNLISKLVDHIIQDFPVTLYGEALRFPTKHKQGILSVIVKIKTTTKLFYRLLQQVQVIGGIVEFNLLFIFIASSRISTVRNISRLGDFLFVLTHARRPR